MTSPTLVFIAFALAMDAFAVSLSTGVTMREMHLRKALRMAFFFGAFQALMPIAGWSVGRFAAEWVMAFDHWIAFGLLSAVGAKMIFEALRSNPGEEEKRGPHNLYILLTLSFATSIDAAAIGITLSFLNVAILTPALVIGVITFVTSLLGTWLGCRIGDWFGNKVEVAGGLILIGIGVKILIEHLSV